VTADPSRRLGDGAAERLLRGARAGRGRDGRGPGPDGSGGSDGSDGSGVEAAVARVLAAAAMPRPIDPAREADAMAAFRSFRSAAPRRRWSRRTVRAGLGAAAAGVVLAGVAVAAGTGAVPFRPSRPAHRTAAPTPSVAPGAGPGASAGPSAGGADASSGPGAGRGSSSPGLRRHGKSDLGKGAGQATAAEVKQLCRAYEGARDGLGAPLTAPEAGLLADVAGGSSRVTGYCLARLGNGGGPSTKKAHPDKPSTGSKARSVPTPKSTPSRSANGSDFVHTPGGVRSADPVSPSPVSPSVSPSPAVSCDEGGEVSVAVYGGDSCLP
jgi:hypothetical protein